MTDKELFNAINEIDEKYVAAAWNNTDLTSDTVVIHESGKASKLRALGLAAACVGLLCTAVLAVYVRVGQRNAFTQTANGSDTGSSLTSIDPIDHSDLRGTGPLPITLFGADLIPLDKADVEYVGLPGQNAGLIGSALFNDDNWKIISCDNFTYFAPSAGLSTNSIDDPELYADYSLPDAGFDIGTFDNSDYKRYNVGGRYGSLTLTDAGCSFTNQSSAPGECLSSCHARFDGSVTLNAYLLRSSTVTSALSDITICVPKARCPLPVMFPYWKDGEFVSKSYTGGTLSGDFVYTSEYPPIYLQNADKMYLDELFDTDKEYVEVTITLSDIGMMWMDGIGIAERIDANIVSVAKPGEPLPFELYGPDNMPITKGDVTGVTLPDGKKISVDKLSADNWASVVCDGFTYVAPPTGGSTNSLDDPEIYSAFSVPDSGSFNNSDYKRLNVGDKFGDLTLRSAATIFRNYGSSPAEQLSECIAEFDGSVTLDAYIIRGITNTTSPGAFICVPKSSETAIPVMFPLLKDGKFTSKSYLGDYLSGEFKYTSEYPPIYVQNVNSYNLVSLFGGYDKYIAEVTVTLSNFHMDWYTLGTLSDFILADIDEIRPKTVIQTDDPLPFELYGPDYRQISFDDADDILDEYMNVIPRDQLTADNWDQIWCEGFCYLSAPAGENYNSIDDADCFKENGAFDNIYNGALPRYDYRRFNVGDSINGLRIESAMTVFSRTDEHPIGAPGEKEADDKLYMSNVSFEGETVLNAYLVVSDRTVYCVPLRGEKGLPVMLPARDRLENDSSAHTEMSLATAEGTFFCRTELPVIHLWNNNGIDLSEYIGSGGCVKAALTLDNISMSYTRNTGSITANIKSIAVSR